MINLSTSDHKATVSQSALPDLTAMLDILFILLVFFMLTVGTIYQSLDLKLPSSIKQEMPQDEIKQNIMLEVGHDQYALDGKSVHDLEEFKKLIFHEVQKKSNYGVIIAGDKDISIEKLLNVLTYLRSQGIETANILMQEKGSM